jgi:hypothetical protein
MQLRLNSVADAEDKGQAQGRPAASGPVSEVAVRTAGIYLTWPSVETVTANDNPMDVELLFSRSPLAGQAGRQFAFTRPVASQTLKLPAGRTRVTVPDGQVKRNLLVEVNTLGNTQVAPGGCPTGVRSSTRAGPRPSAGGSTRHR